MVTGVLDISTDPRYNRATDPNMTLSSNLEPDDTLTLGGSTVHPYLYGPCYDVALRVQPSCSLWSRSWTSILALLATWATDLNRDPDCGWDIDPDMASGSPPAWLTS